MKRIMKVKVNQNSNTLLSTGGKRPWESGVHDPVYTIGMKLTNRRVPMSGEGNAKGNIMGRIMEKSRN